MMIAPRPPDELERLETLRSYEILDSPPEEAFDRYTALAAWLFGVPMARIAFVDSEREWVKASIGLEPGATSRDLSLCAHAILNKDITVVQDAAADPRFKNTSLVAGPAGVRFYAGAPLTAPDGRNVGALCIMNTVPGDLDLAQQAILRDLALSVVDELEFRRTTASLRRNESILLQTLRENNQLAVAVNSLTSGVVITDPKLPGNPIVFANPGFYAITGYGQEETIGHNCRFLQGPETDPAILAELRDCIAGQRLFSGVLVNYRKDGAAFVNELIVNPVFDKHGRLLSFVGLQNDVTKRVQAELAMREARTAAEQANQLLEKRVQERTAEVAQSQIEILTRLASAAELRDDDTGQHTQRVARTAGLIARSLGASEYDSDIIRQAAPLHDVGKIAISDLILLKPGKLTDEEFGIMKTHAAAGAALLAGGSSAVVQMAERIAGSHHERWDGKGYPQRLAGEGIPIEARIVSVADVFDALTHERPYKKAWAVADAVEEIGRMAGQAFDPRIVEAFLQLRHDELL